MSAGTQSSRQSATLERLYLQNTWLRDLAVSRKGGGAGGEQGAGAGQKTLPFSPKREGPAASLEGEFARLVEALREKIRKDEGNEYDVLFPFDEAPAGVRRDVVVGIRTKLPR